MAVDSSLAAMWCPMIHHRSLIALAVVGFTLALAMGASSAGALVAVFTAWYVDRRLGAFEPDLSAISVTE